MYSIIDIETTGGTKITEISIFIHDGQKVIDEFTTLVNPESNIPPFITSLTGINNAMVSNAPKFYEIAKKVYEITKDTIFVAHNVNFDFNIIQKEFKLLGADFKRKKLCTIRLSRKLIPGLKSYSLGSLCVSQGINIINRHRARGDAEATVILFEKLLKLDNQNIFDSFLNPRSREATLPPLLAKNTFDSLSEKEGVYYFMNQKKDIIYVGKANNIKQRVLSHFYDKSKKEVTMCLEISDISFTETGSELLALLLESSEIKRLFPKFNRAQRRTTESIAMFSYEDRNGILHLAFNKVKQAPNSILKFYNVTECRVFMENLCKEFELCPKYCHLQTNVESCFHYQIKQCRGVCRNEEEISIYNLRVKKAIDSVRFQFPNFIINEKGRTQNENAFVLILNGVYQGFGYLDKKIEITSVDNYLETIIKQKDNKDVNRILNSYLRKNEKNSIHLKENMLHSKMDLFVLSNEIN